MVIDHEALKLAAVQALPYAMDWGANDPRLQGANANFRRLASPEAIRTLLAEREQMAARIAELERDAARYRWLRKTGCDSYLYEVPGGKVFPPNAKLCTRLGGYGAHLDSTIDTAMSAAPTPGGE